MFKDYLHTFIVTTNESVYYIDKELQFLFILFSLPKVVPRKYPGHYFSFKSKNDLPLMLVFALRLI